MFYKMFPTLLLFVLHIVMCQQQYTYSLVASMCKQGKQPFCEAEKGSLDLLLLNITRCYLFSLSSVCIEDEQLGP
jgi:hypothetical protein